MLVPPSPKFHDQMLTPPVEVSVKETVKGMAPLVEDAVKFATGNGGLTLIVVALEDEPNELETVRITV